MLQRPPQGKSVVHVSGPIGLVVWQPGNGSKYVLQATHLGVAGMHDVVDVLGGTVMVALSSMADNTFVAHAVSPATTGHWTRDYVRKKWQRIYGIGDHAAHLAMLLNWTLGGERARKYADELWRKAHGEEGKVVALRGRVRRG